MIKRDEKLHYIPEWAERRQMRQVDVVEALQGLVDKSTVSRWFAGKMAQADHLEALRELFSLDAVADLFRHPDENAEPIHPDVSNDEWILWARPIWYGIRETDTLQAPPKKNDEKHIAPLQLGTIERCIRLWSNPGELILSPFAGIGSEGHEAMRLGRRFVGIELKEEYFLTALKNLRRAEGMAVSLFDGPMNER